MKDMIAKRIKKIIFLSLFLNLFTMNVHAQLMSDQGRDDITSNMITAGSGAEYSTAGGEGDYLLSTVAGKLVSAFLGLLGIIFLVMIIIGGFNWMTAAGNEDKVTKAKATLYRGIIGLIIVVTAYVITAFVFRALGGIVGAPG